MIRKLSYRSPEQDGLVKIMVFILYYFYKISYVSMCNQVIFSETFYAINTNIVRY